MLQIIDLENNELLTQVASEESATIIGGASIGALETVGFGVLTALATNILGNSFAHALIALATANTLVRG
jgi:hypothetical protein